MNANTWFELPYRDNSLNKYIIEISQLHEMDDSYKSVIRILNDKSVLVAKFKIKFSRTWIATVSNEDNFANIIGKKYYSSLIAFLVRDYVFGKKLKDLNETYIHINELNEFGQRVYRLDNGKLGYKRDPVIIAKENRFARDLVLRVLFDQSASISLTRENLIHKCNYYQDSITNAMYTLSDKKYIDIENKKFVRLTYNGAIKAENKFISPYSDKIFLIAACNDLIDRLIELVYRPAVEELDYDLIFQEKNEPKDSIHEDIWNFIESSKLIICDLTDKRPNCFIEYGFAYAKGKHIILCVEENEGKTKNGHMKIPFDTQTQRYSFWRKEWLSDEKYKDELIAFKNEIKERVRMKIAIIESQLNV